MSLLKREIGDAITLATKQYLNGQGLGGKKLWADLDKTSRDKIRSIIASELANKDSSVLALGLLDAFSDNRFTGDEIRSVVIDWAETRVTGVDSTPLKTFLDALKDGSLSKTETVSVLTQAVQARVRDTTIQSFLTALLNGKPTNAAALGALNTYLDNSTLAAGTRSALKQLIQQGNSGAQDLLLLLSAWAAAVDEEQLAQLLSQKDLAANPEKTVLAWLNGRLPEEGQKIFGLVEDQNWNGLAALVLASLYPDLHQELFAKVAQGDLEGAIEKQLEVYLQKFGVPSAPDISRAIIELAMGTRSLFVDGPESDAPQLKTSRDIALWQEIREVIYSTLLFVKGGDVVSTSAQGDLHVFAAANIRLGTKLNAILPDGDKAEAQDRKDFCLTLTALLDAHFEGRFNKRYRDEGAHGTLALNYQDMIPESHGHIGSCLAIYGSVNLRFTGF